MTIWAGLLKTFGPALLVLALVAGLMAWQRYVGAQGARDTAVLNDAKTAAKAAQTQARVNAEDKANSDAASEARVIIIREADHAADEIERTSLAPRPDLDALRDLRDRAQRLRDENAKRRRTFLDARAGAAPVRP